MKKLFPFAVFLSVALASLVMAGFAYFASEEAGRIKFAATADDALARIRGADGPPFVAASRHPFFLDVHDGRVSRNDFETFVKGLDLNRTYTGLRGIGFLRLAGKNDDAAVEAYLKEQYGVTRKIWPETGLPRRLPVVLFAPLASTDGIGYDMYSDPLRRPALDAAISKPGARATGRVQLGQVSVENSYRASLFFFV